MEMKSQQVKVGKIKTARCNVGEMKFEELFHNPTNGSVLYEHVLYGHVLYGHVLYVSFERKYVQSLCSERLVHMRPKLGQRRSRI
jgi:hypothetical protein